MMQCSVWHQGVPLGLVQLDPAGLAVGELRPYRSYESIRGIILPASYSLWAAGFFRDGLPAPLEIPPETIRRAAELQLELRTEDGREIATDFVNIIERPSGLPVVFARFRLAHASEPAVPQRLPIVAPARIP